MRQFDEGSKALTLADFVSMRNEGNYAPPLLFLGAGCSVSSGCPTQNQIVEHCCHRFNRQFTSLDDIAKELTDDHADGLFKGLVGDVKPNTGYALLAQLSLKGFFHTIVTTNWDPGLEVSLRHVKRYEKLRVFARTEIPDTEIATGLTDLAHDQCALVYLHGSLHTRKIAKRRDLLKLGTELEDWLARYIKANGAIFVGYSLSERRLARILNDAEDVWVVDPFREPTDDLEELSIVPERWISGDDALFDNFMQGLCAATLARTYKKRTLYSDSKRFDDSRTDIDPVFVEIDRVLKRGRLTETEAETQTTILMTRIAETIKANPKSCVVFIHDTVQPGGHEIFQIAKRKGNLAGTLLGAPICIAHLPANSGNWNVQRDVKEVCQLEAGPPLQGSDYDLIILVDDVSFSGQTLRAVKSHIIQGVSGIEPRFMAALLQIDQELEKDLQVSGWTVYAISHHEGFGLTTPWGFVRPTRPLIGETDIDIKAGIERDLEASDFYPQPTMGFIPKPWGEVRVYRDNSRSSTRVLYFERGQRTSLHYHLLRDEVFVVLDDRIRIAIWDRFLELTRHQALRMPRGVPHAIIADDSPCRILEIADGYCDARFDLFRIEDNYGREVGPFGPDGHE